MLSLRCSRALLDALAVHEKNLESLRDFLQALGEESIALDEEELAAVENEISQCKASINASAENVKSLGLLLGVGRQAAEASQPAAHVAGADALSVALARVLDAMAVQIRQAESSVKRLEEFILLLESATISSIKKIL